MDVLLAHAAAGGGAAVAGLTTAYLLLLFMLVTLIGLQKGYDATLGALLRDLADSARGIRWVGGSIASAIEGIDHFVMRQIGRAIGAVERASSETWNALTWIVRELADSIAELASDTYTAVQGVVLGEIPTQVGNLTAATGRSLAALRRFVRVEVARVLRAQALRAKGLALDLENAFGKAFRGIDAIRGVSIPRLWRALAGAAAAVLALKRYVYGNLSRRLSRVEGLLLGGALTAAILSVLARRLPWYRCTNVRRWNRFLCRLPLGFLDDLLGLAGAVVVLSDVCRIGRAVASLARAVEEPMLAIVTAADAGTRCTTFPPPPELPLRAAALPASEALVSL